MENMLSNISSIVLLSLLLYLMVFENVVLSEKKNVLGPHLEDEDSTTCREFGRFARFNPNSVLNDLWVVFYYWAPALPIKVFTFYAPSTRRKKLIQTFLNDSMTKHPVNWTLPLFVMKNKSSNFSALLVQMSDRGDFLRYPIVKKGVISKKGPVHPDHVIFKQTGDGKYIGYMQCSDDLAYVMARPHDIPKKAKIQDEAARIGFRARKGKSYLYQGHEWMPIGEDDDEMYTPDYFYNHYK